MTDQPPHEPGPSYPPLPPQQPPYGYGYGQPAPYSGQAPLQVAPKSPALALLASFFIPGLGSMMNGEAGKGIGILVGYVISLVLMIVLVGVIGVLAFWVWGMVDAYQGAQRWNLRHGILS
jgi:TM2 domain-containing membrane protein YozV